MAAAAISKYFFIFLFIREETKLVEPLEELVALGEVPCVDGVVMTAVLDIEYLAVLAQFVVRDTVAGPGVLHAIDEHHVAAGLLRPVFAKTNDVKMTMGRFLDELDEKNNEKVIVIDKTTQGQLFDMEEDPIGKLVFINNIAYKIIGVWEGYPNSGGGEGFVPFSTLKKITNKNDYFMLNFTTYGLDTKEANEAFESYLRTQLASLHEFDPTDDSSIYINSTMLQYLETNKIMNTLQLFIWISSFCRSSIGSR